MAERLITVDDVIRAGACADGVAEVVQRIGDKLAAAMPVSRVLRLVEDDEREYVMRAAELDGYGYGYGSGDGYGYGYGSGYGDGYGYGSGDGYGSGIETRTGKPGLHCWKRPKLEHKRLMNVLLQTQMHIIFSCRAKERVEQGKDGNGKTIIVNTGSRMACVRA